MTPPKVWPVAKSTAAATAPWCKLARPPEAAVGSRVIAIAGTPWYTMTRISGVPPTATVLSAGCD